mgnify:CR=1 FL=1
MLVVSFSDDKVKCSFFFFYMCVVCYVMLCVWMCGYLYLCIADLYGNAMSITAGRKKKNASSVGGSSGTSTRRSRQSRSREERVIETETVTERKREQQQRNLPRREVVVNTELCDEKLNSVGELGGSIRCSVKVEVGHTKYNQHRSCDDSHESIPDYVDMERRDESAAEEVAEEDELHEDSHRNNHDNDTHQHHQHRHEHKHTQQGTATTPSSAKKIKRSMDFTQTVKTDIHEEEDVDYLNETFDRFDELVDPSTPDHGMGATQNVRDFNTLAESDSVNEIFLCSIDEDIQEEESKSRVDEEEGEGESCLQLDHSIEECCDVLSTLNTIGSAEEGGEDEEEASHKDYGNDSFEDGTTSLILSQEK